MVRSESEIKENIIGYIWGYGGSYSSWYVGVSEDPKERLFNEHGVREKEDAWIYQKASSVETARKVKNYFVDVLGIEGIPGMREEGAVFVYAYKKKPHTNL